MCAMVRMMLSRTVFASSYPARWMVRNFFIRLPEKLPPDFQVAYFVLFATLHHRCRIVFAVGLTFLPRPV